MWHKIFIVINTNILTCYRKKNPGTKINQKNHKIKKPPGTKSHKIKSKNHIIHVFTNQ